jgi:predicted transcriptional regulator
LINQAELNKNLIFRIVGEGLLIQPVKKSKKGWKEAFENTQTKIIETLQNMFAIKVTKAIPS